jgi:predicted ATP-grasp superfamily ATP-dependent carboligase
LKIFICEFITGGGLYREPLPPSLLKEGAMMRDAVLHDFSGLENMQILMTYDARLSKPSGTMDALSITEQDDVWAIWASRMEQADVVLLIAPETGGYLTQLSAMAERLNKMVLGCHTQAVQIAANKYQTYQHLRRHNIPTPSTYLYADWPQNQGTWIAKPIDGAGCADTAVFENPHQLDAWMQTRKESHIIQPFVEGIPASLSMLCKAGKAYLLTCNRQKISFYDAKVEYQGGVVNDLTDYRDVFQYLAVKIAQAFSGLAGYVGVDLIVNGDDIYVLEINPRLTTSYVAMHQACGVNPARMLLDLFYNEAFELPAIAYRKVDISLGS